MTDAWWLIGSKLIPLAHDWSVASPRSLRQPQPHREIVFFKLAESQRQRVHLIIVLAERKALQFLDAMAYNGWLMAHLRNGCPEIDGTPITDPAPPIAIGFPHSMWLPSPAFAIKPTHRITSCDQ